MRGGRKAVRFLGRLRCACGRGRYSHGSTVSRSGFFLTGRHFGHPSRTTAYGPLAGPFLRCCQLTHALENIAEPPSFWFLHPALLFRHYELHARSIALSDCLALTALLICAVICHTFSPKTPQKYRRAINKPLSTSRRCRKASFPALGITLQISFNPE